MRKYCLSERTTAGQLAGGGISRTGGITPNEISRRVPLTFFIPEVVEMIVTGKTCNDHGSKSGSQFTIACKYQKGTAGEIFLDQRLLWLA